VSLILLLVPD